MSNPICKSSRNIALFAVFTVMLLGLFSPLSALAEAGTRAERLRIAPSYDHLKTLSQERGRVRVIASIKLAPVGFGALRGTDELKRNLHDTMRARGLNAKREFRKLPLAVYELTKNQLDVLIDSGLVEQVHEDHLNRPSLEQSRELISASSAHNSGFTGRGAAVAIIDTGTDTSHPAFAGRIVEEACFSTDSPSSGIHTLCPGGNSQQFGAGSSAPCTGFSACSHGTHVASIAAGSDTRVTGVAPEADIISIQGFLRYENQEYCGSPDCIVAADSDLILAMEYVESLSGSYDIASVNLSLGGNKHTSHCDSLPYKAVIDLLRQAGIVTVIASGNQGYTNAVNAPGCVSSAITVGSVNDTSDAVSSWSNSAAMVDVLAPGQTIYAAVPGSAYASKQGTSMATPHVAGVAAIIKGVDSTASADEIESLIKTSGVTVVDSRNGLSFPRIDLAQVTAVLALSDGVPQLNIISPIDDTVTTQATVVLTASAVDAEDGDLASALTWTSNLDGIITSPAVLSVGSHVITASVTDAEGYTATAAVTIVINAISGC